MIEIQIFLLGYNVNISYEVINKVTTNITSPRQSS